MSSPQDRREPAPVRRRWLREALFDDPAVRAIVVYALIAMGAAATAYFAIFTTYQPYDDEGTLLTTLRAFVEGDALYSEIFTPYGPFYYEVFGGLFALTGWSVTTDASRLIVVFVWVATSALYGIAAQRLTGRLTLGAAAMMAAFGTLLPLVNEPMHPHGLASLLIAAFVAVLVIAGERRPRAAGLAGGALLIALVLTKINLGAFAIAATVLATALSVETFKRRGWILWPVIVAFLAVPAAVMVRDLGESWVRDLILLQVLAGAAIVVTAWAPPRLGRDPDRRLVRWLLAALAGGAAMAVVVLGILIGLGLSPGDVYEGIVTDALEIRDTIVGPYLLPAAAINWAIFGLALALVAVLLRLRQAPRPSSWEGVLRILAGLTIWLTIIGTPPFRFAFGTSFLAVPLILAWVAALPPANAETSPFARFLRILLPALAVAQVTQIYPVPGTQQAIAAVIFVPVGALCLADGLALLRLRAAASGPAALERLAIVVLVFSVALAGKMALDQVIRPGLNYMKTYRALPALALPGAEYMRLPPSTAEPSEQLVALLREHECSTLVSYPGLNSLYLWAELPVPKPGLPGPWVRLLDDDRQREAVDSLRASPRPCAIRNETLALQTWARGDEDTPLLRYIDSDFKPVDAVGEFEFLIPADDS